MLVNEKKIAVGLLERTGLFKKGQIIYLDNYCSSPELAKELDFHDTVVLCDTVHTNHRGIPEAFAQVKLKAGESVLKRNNTLVIKFHEKKRCLYAEYSSQGNIHSS